MEIYHNSYETEYRKPFGAAPCGSEVQLSLYSPQADSASLRLYTEAEGEKLLPGEKDSRGYFNWTVKMPSKEGLVWYYFIVKGVDGILCYGNNPQNRGGAGTVYCEGQTPVSYKISVYHPFSAPQWYKEGIAYSIFPDRFCRASSDNGCGRYMEEWDTLPYYIRNDDGSIREWNFWGGDLKGIASKLDHLKSLGVSLIYLNPIFKARSNHRYDTADYFAIDPMLGTEQDFKDLCKKAAKLGIRIMLDGVFNHTGSDSPYFREHPDWYLHDQSGIKCWWGVKDLPEVDELNKEFSKMICGKDGVLAHWIKEGASGWRLDVADELPNEFLRRIRKAVKSAGKDNVLIGEVWEDASDKIDYGVRMEFLGGKQLDSVMNYPLREDILAFTRNEINAAEFASRQMSRMENYPKEAFYACFNCIGSHDRERIMTLLGSEKAVKFATVLQYAMPGVPVIYYGDEFGLDGGRDPENRSTIPWDEVPKLQKHYEALGALRNASRSLKKGDLRVFSGENDKLIVERSFGAETLRFCFDPVSLTYGISKLERIELDRFDTKRRKSTANQQR